MRKALLLAALLVAALCHAQVGTWKAFMAYYEPQQIVKASDNYLYVLASNSLYQYNLKDKSITTFDCSRQLNDTRIAKIEWNSQVKKLLIVYENANIDIVSINGDVNNVSSIYSKPMTTAKTVNHIYMYEQYAFIATAFGIVKLNMERAEISETYFFDGGIKSLYVENGAIIAQCNNKTVISGELTGKNLMDKNNWETTKSYNANSFLPDETTWNQYIDLVNTLKPVGPKHNYFGFMKFIDGKLYTCSGYGGGLVYRPGTIQVYDGSDWIIYEDDFPEIVATEGTRWKYEDSYSIAVDPRDSKHVMSGARPGLFEYYDGKLVKYYNKDNSILKPASSSNRYVLVPCVLYDKDANLWIMQRDVPENSIMEITADGEWISWYQEELIGSNEKSLPGLTNLTQDSRGLMWFLNFHWEKPSFYCFDPTTKKIISSTTRLVNQDGIISESFFPQCITEDMAGNLWLGTSTGLYLIEESTIGKQLEYVTQVKVPRNDGTNYADYLMDGVYINCIAVDQANRKWIGTSGAGLYLISADNMEQLENFTSANSPLISDNIESLAIDHETGEVFIGTDQGLCSYMSDATSVSIQMVKDDVYAYPNPVVSGYDGLITIVGLTRDADVKILTVNGQLVAQGRSNGGSFTWNGRDSGGKRVASGIYMVATAKSDGTKGTVCKIAIIR